MYEISDAFERELRSPVHTFRVKAEVLDTNFSLVEGGRFHGKQDGKGQFQNLIVDGSVDVDVARATRRTFAMTMLNNEGEFSPGTDWAGMFYVDRLIRIYRGLVIGDVTEYVPVGTFLIDNADVVVERNMSVVILAGSDLWKMLAKAELSAPRTFAAGVHVNTVIKTLAEECGVDRFNLDDLASRSTEAKTLQKKLVLERKQKVGEILLKLAADFGIDIYFDVLGRLVTQDFKDPDSTSPVWVFEPGEGKLLLSLRSSFRDENFANSAIVYGTGNKQDDPIVATKKDTDPASPVSIERIGERTVTLESDDISTQAQANAAVEKLFYKHYVFQNDFSLEAICNPALEGNDTVLVRELEYSNTDARVRARSFNVLLTASRQGIKLQRMVRVP